MDMVIKAAMAPTVKAMFVVDGCQLLVSATTQIDTDVKKRAYSVEPSKRASNVVICPFFIHMPKGMIYQICI